MKKNILISRRWTFLLFSIHMMLVVPIGYSQNLQPYPLKPLRLIVGSTPGGGPDLTARILAPKLSEALVQQVIVENRVGASTMIATEFVAKSGPDGYTLLMAGGAHVANVAMHKSVGYHPLNDFYPLTQVVSLPFVLIVHPSLPVKNVRGLIGILRNSPGILHFGSSGSGTPPHLSMELFLSLTKTSMVHIPYKGNSQAMIDVLAGHIPVMMQSPLTALPHIKANRVRALGVTSSKASVSLPGVPPISSAGVPGYEAVQWYGILAPSGTPREIAERLQSEVAKILRLPDVKERFLLDGAETVGSTPEQFSAFIRNEAEKWLRLVKSNGIKSE